MEKIEVSAKTVNDAIMKACMDLGVPSDELEIEVVSEGSRGFLGIGGKPAVIKVSKKEEKKPVREKSSEKAARTEKSAERKEKKAPVPVKEEKPVKTENTHKKQEQEEERKAEPADTVPAAEEKRPPREENGRPRQRKRNNNKKNYDRERPETREKEKPEIKEKTEEEIAAMKTDAQKFLNDVFKAMDLTVETAMEYEKEGGCLSIDLSGEDMGVLIGKRGQTLDSLQYLTSLVVNKGQKDYIRIKLDTEDYRRRRKETLENLAKNIANKVRKTRRPVVLEAMNPYERRIIHSALQSNKYVETYSEGNEPYRHVVVTLKKEKKYDPDKAE